MVNLRQYIGPSFHPLDSEKTDYCETAQYTVHTDYSCCFRCNPSRFSSKLSPSLLSLDLP